MLPQFTTLTVTAEPGVHYDLSSLTSLESLTLNDTSKTRRDLPTVRLPINLKHLHAFDVNVFLLNVYELTSLETLECDFISSTMEDNLPGAIIPFSYRLPVSLKTIKATPWGQILRDNTEIIGPFHSNLTSLEFPIFHFSPIADVVVLPKTLTSFKSGEFLASEFPRLQALPNLQELNIYTNEGHLLSPFLPASLTSLTLKDSCGLPIALPPHLHLTRLDFCGCVVGSVINIPATVTDLSLNFKYSGTQEVFDLSSVKELLALRLGRAKITPLNENQVRNLRTFEFSGYINEIPQLPPRSRNTMWVSVASI